MIATINENICSSYKEESIQEEPNILHECVCVEKTKAIVRFPNTADFLKNPHLRVLVSLFHLLSFVILSFLFYLKAIFLILSQLIPENIYLLS